MDMIKVTYNDGSFRKLTWKKQNDGLFTAFSNHYDNGGYYDAGLSGDIKDLMFEEIEKCADACKHLFTNTVIY